MPSILTKKYNTFLSSQFLADLTDARFSAYLFLSHPQEWSDADDETINDSNPPAPSTSPQAVEYGYWRDIIGAKRIAAANTAPVIARRDWKSGTVYDQYDDATENLHTTNFYVLDVEEVPYRVYKCLWNNDGAESTVAPSTIGTALNPQETLDGYVWQYMYTVTSDDHKFLTDTWMPVRSNTDIIENATIYAGRLPTAVPLLILDGGAGYNAAISISATLTGDGLGATVLPEGISVTGGAVSRIVLSAGGVNYTQVNSINVYQSGATVQATARAIVPPYPNHGADPVKELHAVKLMMVSEFVKDEGGDLTVVNNFRRAGLLINPLDASTGLTANAAFYKQTWDITLSSNTGIFNPDDVVTNITKDSTPSGVAVDVVGSVIRLTSVNVAGETEPFTVGDVIKCLDTGVEAIVDAVATPELTPYTGSVVYINQRTPVTRDTAQTEVIKLVVPFG